MQKGTDKESNPLSLAFKKVQKGDAKAFEQIFLLMYPALYSYAMRYLSHAQAVEELLQDVFLTLWEKRSSLQIHTSLKSYLYTVSRNRALNYLRSHKNDVMSFSTGESSLHQLSIPPQIEQTLSEEDLDQMTRQALATLPPRCRAIFSLSRYESMTYPAIATHLGLSTKTVERQMSIALKKLRAFFKIYDPLTQKTTSS